jgi:type II secretory pathway pseudopilin PulG
MKKLLLLLLLLPTWLFSATYYVDATSGDDDSTGLATDKAWQTLEKVNSSSFSAGDNIYFKRGETWSDTLEIPSSGSSGNNITFGAYGTGILPVITGGGSRGYCILGTAKNFITIENLKLTTATLAGLLSDGCNGWTIESVTVDSCGDGDDYGIFLHSDDYTSEDGDHTINNCTITNTFGDGIFCQRVRNLTITNNTITASYAVDAKTGGDNIQFLDCTDAVLRGNSLSQEGSDTVKGNMTLESPSTVAVADFLIEKNELAYGQFGLGLHRADGDDMDSVIVRYNYIHDQAAGGQIQALQTNTKSHQIYYNLLVNGFDGINYANVAQGADTFLYPRTQWFPIIMLLGRRAQTIFLMMLLHIVHWLHTKAENRKT